MSEKPLTITDLPFKPEFGLEDLGAKVNTSGPYRVVESSPNKVVIETISTEKQPRIYRETLSPHDSHPHGRANWQAAAKQLGLPA